MYKVKKVMASSTSAKSLVPFEPLFQNEQKLKTLIWHLENTDLASQLASRIDDSPHRYTFESVFNDESMQCL